MLCWTFKHSWGSICTRKWKFLRKHHAMCFSSQHKNRASDRDIRNRTLLIFHFSPLFSFSSKSLCHLHRFLCHTFLSLSACSFSLPYYGITPQEKQPPLLLLSFSLSSSLFQNSCSYRFHNNFRAPRERERIGEGGREGVSYIGRMCLWQVVLKKGTIIHEGAPPTTLLSLLPSVSNSLPLFLPLFLFFLLQISLLFLYFTPPLNLSLSLRFISEHLIDPNKRPFYEITKHKRVFWRFPLIIF